MIRIAICDDDRAMVNELNRSVSSYLDQQHLPYEIDHFLLGTELIAAASSCDRETGYSIVLLDIDMPEIDGIDTARILRKSGSRLPIIIFITALENHMKDAFDVRAFHYILKPVQQSKLEEVLFKAIEEARFLSNRDAPFLVVTSERISRKIYYHDIYYIDCFRKKATIHMKAGTVGFYSNMADIEAMLDDTFYRCHRSTIVNMRYLAQYDSSGLKLADGTVLPIARPQHTAFVKAFMRFLQQGGNVDA